MILVLNHSWKVIGHIIKTITDLNVYKLVKDNNESINKTRSNRVERV